MNWALGKGLRHWQNCGAVIAARAICIALRILPGNPTFHYLRIISKCYLQSMGKCSNYGPGFVRVLESFLAISVPWEGSLLSVHWVLQGFAGTN